MITQTQTPDAKIIARRCPTCATVLMTTKRGMAMHNRIHVKESKLKIHEPVEPLVVVDETPAKTEYVIPESRAVTREKPVVPSLAERREARATRIANANAAVMAVETSVVEPPVVEPRHWKIEGVANVETGVVDVTDIRPIAPALNEPSALVEDRFGRPTTPVVRDADFKFSNTPVVEAEVFQLPAVVETLAPVVSVETPVVEIAPAPVEVVEEQHKDIRQRAMLVHLTIHRWLARATDDAISDDVAEKHGIADDMGAYRKQLLSSAALAKLRSAARKLRKKHNRLTLPWEEGGTRILSASAFMAYNEAIRPAIDEFEQIFRDEFEAIGSTGKPKYEEHIAEARQLLNGAFKEADYPTLASLRHKFRARVIVSAIPSGDDFRIDLGAEATEAVRREISERSTELIDEAMQGVYGQLRDVVSALAEALNGDKLAGIRESLFTTCTNLIERLPYLNVTGDAKLSEFANATSRLLASYSAKELRISAPSREQARNQADAILSQMNDFLG